MLSAPTDREAVFLERPNRFLGIAEIDGGRERIHVPDSGRLRELLYPRAGILVRRAPPGSARKTAWTLMAARSPLGDGWILTNSLLHGRIARSLLSSPALSPFGEATDMRAEVPVGGSRLDFRLQTPESGPVYVAVKGCILVEDGEGLFPDAPTSREGATWRSWPRRPGRETPPRFCSWWSGLRGWWAPTRPPTRPSPCPTGALSVRALRCMRTGYPITGRRW